MPELPEVETVKLRLAALIVGKKIKQVKVQRDKSFPQSIESILGTEIKSVDRQAKVIHITLSNDRYLLIHLKMTGQLIYLDDQIRAGGGHPTTDWVNELPSKHTRVTINFTDGSTLFFNDMRVFGWIKVLTKNELDQELAKYGPDINDPALELSYWQAQLAKRKAPIKQVLLDSKVVAGLGNIYVCEALHLARIHPTRPAQSLSDTEAQALLQTSQQVIQRGIELGGTTYDGKYVGVDGLAGGYQNELLVYAQAGQPCQTCEHIIEKIKLGGRGTYFCGSCQK